MGITFPALGFPLYGLDGAWDGPRWLQFVEGRAGDPTTGAWVGVTTSVPEVDVVVVGHDIEPNALVLSEVVDSSAYHFDRDQPITFPEAVEGSRVEALGATAHDPEHDVGSWWPAHPDQAAAVQ